jgi:peptidoglycan/LPS O-acetylase OafA/YrhL
MSSGTDSQRTHILALSAASGVIAVFILSGSLYPFLTSRLSLAATTFGFCCFHIGFLLIGSMLYRTSKDPMTERLVWGAAACGVFALTVTAIIYIGQLGPTGTTAQNCIAAFLIFVIAAALNGFGSRWLRPLEFVGRISYSLYLIHIPLAWMVMFELAARGVRATGGAFVATALCLLLAWVMYEFVERPAQNVGKMLTKKNGRP